jgi:hypothetical protein
MPSPKKSTLTLKLVKRPSGGGGFRYDDSHVVGDDAKINRTTVYLSQKSIAERFDGVAPAELRIDV